MKKITWNQVKGLAWFCLVYALVRFIVFLPALGDQDEPMVLTFFVAMVIAWLVYTAYRSNQAFLGLSMSISIVIFLYWENLCFSEQTWLLMVMGAVSILSFISVLIYRVSKKKQWLTTVLLHLFGTIFIFVLMEYFILNLLAILIA